MSMTINGEKNHFLTIHALSHNKYNINFILSIIKTINSSDYSCYYQLHYVTSFVSSDDLNLSNCVNLGKGQKCCCIQSTTIVKTDTTVTLIRWSKCYHHVVLVACSVVRHCLCSDSALFCVAKSPGLGKNDVACPF